MNKVSVGSRIVKINGIWCAEYYCFGCKSVITPKHETGCIKCNKLYNWDNIIPESR